MSKLDWITRGATLVALCSGVYFTIVPGYELNLLVDTKSMPQEFGVSTFSRPTIVDADTVHFEAPDAGVFLVRDGRVTPLLTKNNWNWMRGSYGIMDDTLYHAYGGDLAAVNVRKTTTLLTRDDKAPYGSKFYQFIDIDADGDLLAFSFASQIGAGLVTWRDGRLTTILGDSGRLNRDDILGFQVSGANVYVRIPSGVFLGKDAKLTKVIAPGDAVPGGKLVWIHSISASSGLLALTASVAQGPRQHETVLTVSDGTLEMIAEKESGGQYAAFTGDIATNGKAVAYVTVTTGYVDLGQSFFRSPPNHKLVVQQGRLTRTVVAAGESAFGGTLTDIRIGPRAMDPEGNIAFAYSVHSGGHSTNGVAVARPNSAINANSISLYGLATIGAIYELVRRNRKVRAAIPTLEPSNV
ncbi:MAG: hypothetical protein C0483_22225 [Pirellula sp.]|nr:hypothetical protein [Pirellula sp.]